MPQLKQDKNTKPLNEAVPVVRIVDDVARLLYRVDLVDPETGVTLASVCRPSLTQTFHELANILEVGGMYRSDMYDPEAASHSGRPCQYCDGRLFFAETINGRAMPLDVLSVQNEDLIDVVGYLLTVEHRARKTTQARRAPQYYHGSVWVPHPVVCGATTTAPMMPLLRERWEANRGVTLEAEARAKQELIEWLNVS